MFKFSFNSKDTKHVRRTWKHINFTAVITDDMIEHGKANPEVYPLAFREPRSALGSALGSANVVLQTPDNSILKHS